MFLLTKFCSFQVNSSSLIFITKHNLFQIKIKEHSSIIMDVYQIVYTM